MNEQTLCIIANSGSVLRPAEIKRVVTIIFGICLFLLHAESFAGNTMIDSQHTVETFAIKREWGPICRGLQLSVLPQTNIFTLGKSIKVSVLVTNLTTGGISLPEIFPGSGDRYDIKFVVTDSQGHKIPFTKLGSILNGDPSAVSGISGRVVRPKETIEDTFSLDQRFVLGTTGVYFIAVKRLVPNENGKLEPELTSNTTRIKIVPANVPESESDK